MADHCLPLSEQCPSPDMDATLAAYCASNQTFANRRCDFITPSTTPLQNSNIAIGTRLAKSILPPLFLAWSSECSDDPEGRARLD